ncbi:uncharacterized protein LOC132202272 isoform X2 [Neocloeon triangulifer]|uniref:uncharacterized protein LOC132202272 isoform X2 n=1 Tax=Neocloeon triangulifer TaxID=2078957 RepID=UPI00286EB67F|nr:uncharacterized protein LOC132202272 isoform X2 [Neocloeon triangulifer]
MNYYFYLIIVLQASKLFDITQAQKRDGRGKAKYNRNAARQKIVRCCGALSCTQFNAIYKATTAIINGSATSASTVTSRVTNDQATDAKTLTDETQFSQISDAPVQQEETTTTIINDLNSAPSPSEPNLPVVPDSTTETTLPTQNEIPDPITTMQAVETSSSTFTQLESTANPNLNIPSSTPNLLTTTAKIAAPTTTTTEMTTILFIKPTTATTKAPEVYPKCPTLCKRDASLFDLDKSLRDPSDHGFWRTACGSLFVFGKTLANWQQNFDKCCSLGMVPIFFETQAKFTCFNDMIDGFKWPYNTRYWTSGLRGSPSTFAFCQTKASVLSSYWESGQPNNVNKSENCAQLIIKPGNDTAQLADKNCGEISAFACMGPTTPKPACTAPQCPNITCAPNNTVFATKDGPVVIKYLKDPTKHGQWFSTDGRYYVFSYPSDTRTYEQSMMACCSIGLKLISVHQDFTFDLLKNAFKNGKILPAQFWTSGTDLGCEGNFGYCSSNRLLRKEARWVLGQPDDVNKTQNCLTIYVNMTESRLSDENCNLKRRYICEGKSPRTVETIQKECADLYTLTAEQISRLLNDTAKNLKEKCFLKCFGEETGFMKDGKLVQEKILAEFQSLSKGDLDKLTESYSTFDFCTNVTKGMDDCDRASALMKCGQDNSPELMSSLVVNLENTIKGGTVNEAVVMSPNQSSACPSHTCVQDADLKATFDRTPANSSFKSIYGTGKVAEACGKRFLGLNMPALMGINASRFPEAFAICCKFGLRLLILDTTAKQTCLKAQTGLMDFPAGVGGYIIAAFYIDPSVNKTAITCPSGQLVMNQKEIPDVSAGTQGFFPTIRTDIATGNFVIDRYAASNKLLCESN